MSNKPIARKNLGQIQMAIWETDYEGKKGHKFSFQKNYKDKDDKWQNTSYFTPTDLAAIAQLCNATLGIQINNSLKETPKEETSEVKPPI